MSSTLHTESRPVPVTSGRPQPAAPAPAVVPGRWRALALLAVAQFMVVLDASIVNIGLPSMGRGLHLAAGSLAWVITAYVVASGGLLPLGGRLADLLGRRRVFAAGTGLFSAASLAAGLAPTGAALIGTRAVQGVGAALLAPAALALVTGIFPAGAERTRALGIWGAVAGGGGAAGVLLGGLLTGGLGWRSVFLINVPVGAVVLALVHRTVPEYRGNRPARLTARHLDLPGAGTVTGGLVSLVVALSQAPAWGWADPRTLGLLAAGAVLLAAFAVIERSSAYALVPLRLFSLRTVATGNAVMVLTGAAMLGLFYFLSLYEQLSLGYGPVQAGVSQLPLAVALIAAAGLAAPLIGRYGPRVVLAVGLAGFAAGLAWLSQASPAGTFRTDVLGPSLLVGIGLGLAFVPVTAIAVARVPEHHAGVASGLVNVSQQIGGALGLAALATLAQSRTHSLTRSGTLATAALTGGYTAAFLAAAAVAALAALVALAGSRRDDTQHHTA